MQGLLAGLYIAFDTTALALTLSIVLMFQQFLVDRFESQLLSMVDERAGDEVVATIYGGTVRRRSASGRRSADEQCCDQNDREVGTRPNRPLEKDVGRGEFAVAQPARRVGGPTCRNRWSIPFRIRSKNWANRLHQAEREAELRMRARWEQWQTALSDNARLLHSHQTEMTRQGDILSQVLQATGDVIKLEQVLNENLRALAGSKNFEDTVMSLSAAIHLLNTRLGETSRPPGLGGFGYYGIARTSCMRRPRFRKPAVKMSLFPFLAVLICTMGALIVLLVTVVQQARVHASLVSEDRASGAAGPGSPANGAATAA